MSELDDLRSKRVLAYKNMKSSHTALVRVQKLYSALNERHNRDKKVYEDIDKQMALIDGRLKIVVHEKHGKSVPLSNEQLAEIAKALGIPLPEGFEI